MTRRRRPIENLSVVDEYSRLAPDYDTRWSSYIEATTRETITRLNLGPRGRLLDVGCGTGVLLHRVSQSHPDAQLAGIDPVPGMLAVARRRLGSAAELREGWAEALPYEAAKFDVVVSCNMFHYVRRPLVALGEMERVLRPGGQLVITDWCDDYLACRVGDLYLRLFSASHVKMYGKRDCERMLGEAGYAGVAIERYRINWLWGLMTATATKRAT